MSNYLVHHGILGQKWGDRNGPPYPLGASSHSSSEKKEGTKGWSKEAKADNKKTVKTNAQPRRKELTPEQKAMINKALKIGAATIATGAAVYGGYKISGNPKVKQAISKGKTILKNEAIEYKNIMKKSAKESYKGFKEGLPEGSKGAGKTLGKAVAGGVTWMAGIEIADLMTNSAVTQTILTAYNDHVKKDNKVKTSYRNRGIDKDNDD